LSGVFGIETIDENKNRSIKGLRYKGELPSQFLKGLSCNIECQHCMYACSPAWKGDWKKVSRGNFETIGR